MRNLRRNKKPLYLCKKYQDNLLVKYKEPIPLYMNYEPTNSDGDLISLGERYPMYLRIKTDISHKNTFHPKDRLYVYKDLPKEFNSLCKDADYEVSEEPMIYINEVEVILHRLSSDNNG